MNKIVFVLVTLIIVSGSLQAQTVIPYQSSWKYLDNGTDQGTSWRTTSFNDAGWKTGTGKFGYGVTDATTTIDYGSNQNKKYITTYFRKSISISNPSNYSFYVANIKRDDGAIVYVNGTEVYRNNMPTGTIAFTTLATDASDNGLTPQSFNINSSAFVNGTNVIAVEIHQSKANTPDMAFDLQLATPPDQPPSVTSIARQSPLSATTNATSLTYRVIFTEKVTGVDYTDFSLTNTSGSVAGTIGINAVAAVGTDGTTYDITASSVSGNGTLRLDLKSSGTGIMDATGNAITGGFTSGEIYTIDQILPTVLSINRQSPTAATTNVASLTYRVIFSEKVNGVDYTDFAITKVSGTINAAITSTAVTAVGTDGTTYDVVVSSVSGNGILRLDLKSSATGITDAAANSISGGYTNGQTYTVDQTAPTLSSVSIASDNANSSVAIVGNTITLSFTASEPINPPTVTIATHSVTATAGSGNSFTGTYTMTSSDAQGTVPFTINDKDIAGNAGTQVTSTTNSSSVVFNAGGPTVLTINRQSPTAGITNASSVTFRVTFSKKVTGVDQTDFLVTTVSGNAAGSLGSKAVATVGTAGTTYDVTVSSITGNGTLRLDLKSSGTGIIDANNNPISGGFSTGQTYIIDKVVPTVASINRQSPLTSTTNSTSLTYRITFSEQVRNVDNTDFTLTKVSGTATGTILSSGVVATGTDSTVYDVTVTSVSGSGTLRLDLKSNNTGITDAAGNLISGGYTGGQTYTEDQTKPTLSPVSIASDNSNVSLARAGNVVTLSFTASEPLNIPVVTIATHNATVTTGSGNSFTAKCTMTNTDAETIVPFAINFTDLAGNAGIQVTATTNKSKVTFDNTAPIVTSIKRQSPTTDTTTSTSVIFRTSFSEIVTGVDKTDFSLVTTGATTGVVRSITNVNNSTYDITVDSINGNGTLGLNLNSTSTGIADSAGNAIAGGFTTSESYSIASTASFATTLGYIPISINTGEKPQSKLWNYNGFYWTVLANTNGTYLWRLDGTNWTSVLKLSDSTNLRADCKRVGDVTHILLFRGFNGPGAQLVSIQYVPATNTYQLWSPRPSTVGIQLDGGVETAVIDIDGRGRMWLASAGDSDINVRWSDAPYSTWSSPITIATGVDDDDICDVIYMPTAGQIGVLWSNQNTKRFGFRTHTDGARPSAWSADEVPASKSAINFGHGMADDHIHFALASDGTLYCAVKTSYDATGYPKLALLIRRPNATWDSLYEVSETGTRGVALLNESIGKLKIVYTSSETGGNILYKETSTSNISFGAETILLQGTYNNATSTKENYNSDIVILAGDTVHMRAAGILLTDIHSASVPTVPLLMSPLNAATAVIIPANLKWNISAGAASYQVQVSTSSDFTAAIFDQSNIIETSIQIPGLINSTQYYWRVRANNTLGNSDWSAVSNFTTASGGPLMAQWKMDEGNGITLIDSSEYRNDGTTVGNPTWVKGRIGKALQLNGTSQYATVPTSRSLSPATAITLAAWIKPEKAATQYILKKASLNATDGYELSLSNTGRVFFRVNQDSLQNTYRVNSLTSYPTDGNTWMHIAATSDGSVIKIYINGVLDSSNTFTAPVQIISNALDLAIGSGPNGNNKFQGAIDDARVYNKVLSDSEIFSMVANAPLTNPVLASPANAATGVLISPATLSWRGVTSVNPPTYYIQVSTTNDFVSTVFEQGNIPDTSIQIPGLLNSTVYYWRVRSSDATRTSDWSDAWNFTTVSTDPLVAKWKMDEGSGSALIDAAQYQNNATTTGNPVWVQGKIAQALQLDGNAQYAAAPNSASLNLTNSITLAAWIKPEKLATQYIIKKAILSATDGYELSLSNTGQVFFRINQATNQNTYRINSVALYPTDSNTWVHIAATFDGSVLKLYINGKLDNSATLSVPVPINLNTLPVAIAAEPNGGGKFQGAIDDARIYYTALSASEIFNIVVEAPPASPTLVSPSNSTIGVAVNPTTLNWDTATGATSYEVQISTASDFSSITVDQTNDTATSTQVNGLTNNTTYYWRVMAVNGVAGSAWSQTWSFTTVSDNPLVAQLKMDEGSGTVLIDASDYSNNGTTIGNPQWVTGKTGQALQLDGSSQYATVANSTSLNPANAITLAAWVRPLQSGTQYIIKKAISNTTDGYELSLSNTGKVFFRINQQTSADVYRVNSITSFPTDGNTWMHIAATYDGITLKVYVNGVLEGSLSPATPPAISSNTLSLGIGAQPDGTSKLMGAIDDARIYDKALNAADILNIVAETSPVAPTLTSPANNATNIAVNGTNLNWNAVAAASSYQVQVSTVSDFSSTVFDQSDISTNNISVPGLNNFSLYYWRVRATNVIGTGDWSAAWNFTTISNATLVGNWKLEEGSGTTIVDASQYGNNGTTTGNPVWVTGKIGQALQLNGSQYATVPDNGSLNPTNAITLAAWIKPETSVNPQYIIKKAISNTTDGYELSLSNTGKVFFRINQKTSADVYRVNSVTSYPTDGNTWMHVAATYDGTTLKIYVNGVLDASLSPAAPPAISSNTLLLGIGAQSDGTSRFKGAIDEALIYNTALNASDILNIVAQASPVAPVLTSPANSATNIAVNPTNLNWNAIAAVASYQVQVSTVSDFSSTVFDQSNILTNTVAVSGLNNFSRYYWRVRAKNAVGTGDWSAVWNLTTISNATLVGSWKMEEGSGTTIVDASQYGNNGTTTGSPVWVTGKIGQALQLNGTSQYATVPNNGSLNPTNAITLAVWIKPELLSTQNILKKAISGTTDGYELSLSNTGKVFFRINQKTSADAYRVNSLTSYPTDGNTWMHIAATYDGTTLKIYINGVLDASLSPAAPPAISSNTLSLGVGAQPDGTSKFKGAIDEAQVYNVALGAAEIANLATTSSSAMQVTYSRTSQSAELKEKLSIYPNPMFEKATINFVLAHTGSYVLDLYNIKGSRVAVLKQGKTEAGKLNTVEINSMDLAYGVYILRLQTNRSTKTLKIIVQK
jgi:hypothetical protein